MSLIRFDKVSVAFGDHPLLDHVDFQIEPHERVCLVGRNGTGKSTMLKIIAADILPDDGRIVRNDNLVVARLQQDVPAYDDRTVFEVVADGVGELARTITQYHAAVHLVTDDPSEKNLNLLAKHQTALDAQNGWIIEQRIETIITQLSLPADKKINELSGGWRRRALLAQALVKDPDLLLLDEPTNHLDIQAIQWLEDFLKTQKVTLLFITHDRAFLKSLATRIIDLDRGKLTSWPGDYENYLLRKAELLEAEATQNALFDKRLANEEVWIRQGVKARRTRNEGRVRRLEAMRNERQERRLQQGKAKFSVSNNENSGQVVFDAENISFWYDNEKLVDSFSTRIMRGDKVGLIGPNGAGKSTLLQLLVGKLEPSNGTIKRGTNLQIAFFDQQRESLDLEKNLVDNVAEGRLSITVGGKEKHIVSYLRDFLFDPARLQSPVKTLSGGERNRLMLAKLFAKPANLLILDEPTNDLDVETLELLETILVDYEGTILLVSHDRAFIDNVVTSTIVFEGEGRISEYVGGYTDYLRQARSVSPATAGDKKAVSSPKPSAPAAVVTPAAPKRKLSYKEQRELDQLPALIEKLENERDQLQAQIASSEFYKQDKAAVNKSLANAQQIAQQLETAYARWTELDA